MTECVEEEEEISEELSELSSCNSSRIRATRLFKSFVFLSNVSRFLLSDVVNSDQPPSPQLSPPSTRGTTEPLSIDVHALFGVVPARIGE